VQSWRVIVSLNLETIPVATNFSELQITLTDVILAVCKRPKMYTLNGTFGEILALLDGYANGKKLGGRGRSASYFNGYKNWLRERMGSSELNFWPAFREAHSDDLTAISEFGRLWCEYEKTLLDHRYDGKPSDS
jgi:hypothetical protein